MVGTHDQRSVVPQPLLVEPVQNLPEPVIDHRELGPIVGPHVAALPLRKGSLGDGAVGIGRPDKPLLVPRLVEISACPRHRRVEWLMGIELVHKQEPPIMMRGGFGQETSGRAHRHRPRVVLLSPKERASPVVTPVQFLDSPSFRPPPATLLCRHGRSPDPRGVVVRTPRIGGMASEVVPTVEVGVVVLPTGLKQVGMVSHQGGGHALVAQHPGDGLLPQLNRTPRLPQEVQRPAQNVVTGRHTRERPRHMAIEPSGPL